MKAEYQRESVVTLWDEVLPLLHTHWDEIAHFKDIPLDPDIEGYNHLEELGMLRCYTARIDGVLVGYAAFIVRHHPHYMGTLQAQEDVIFLMQEHRKGRVGLGLVMYCDNQLFGEGVQIVGHHAKADHPALSTILKRSGYELVDLIWLKRAPQDG